MTTLEQQVVALLRDGHGKGAIATHLGISRPKVQRIARKYAQQAHAPHAVDAAHAALERTQRFAGDSGEVEVRVPRFITTLEEAIAASGVDTATWEVASWECRHYALPTADGPIQASYVKLRLVKRSLFTNSERIVDAVIKGLESALPKVGTIVPSAVIRHTRPRVLRTRIITDLHFGGYAWDKSTGSENWDIAKASATAFACNRYLDAQVPDDATETLIAFMGDLAHFDTPKGTTTGGTQLDLDSRVDLMLAAVSEYCVRTVADEAERRPVTVLLVTGNHDDILSRAIRRMLLLVFAHHQHVTVLERYTKRQYYRFGDTLLGFSHGDGSRQRLVDAMAVECGRLGLWDGATCREYHLGHVHHESAKQKVLWGAEALQGTVVRTHIALTPADQYHSDNGWVGGTTGMSDYYYAHGGALLGTRVANPLLLDAA